MAMPVVAHFAHPKHEVKLREYHLRRSCDLCGEKLTGRGYSCHRRLCDFDLHEECAEYPETLRSSAAHPAHDLTLAAGTDDGNGKRVCDVCREEVPAGVFLYRCAPCGFDVHPRCSRVPQTTGGGETGRSGGTGEQGENGKGSSSMVEIVEAGLKIMELAVEVANMVLENQ